MTNTRWAGHRLVASLLAAGLLAAITPQAAQAQTSYVMTTLAPPSSGQVGLGHSWRLQRSFGIDGSDNVIGPARYLNGWYWDSNAPYLRKRYDPYVVRWAASTGASVAPTKLLKAPNWTYMSLDVSSSSGKVLVYSDGQAVFDVATLKLGAKMPTTLDGIVVNNAGAVLWQSKDASGITGTWHATSGPTSIPAASNAGLYGTWINNAGEVGGNAALPGELLSRAAKWANGQLTILDQRPGVGSEVLTINDAGQALITSTSRVCTSVCVVMPESQGVLDNGVYTPIAGPGGPVRGQIQSQAMNNRGEVVGCMINNGGGLSNCRGFLWKDRTLYDLTSWLPTRGVTLPAGAYIRDVAAINDKGSMVVELVSSTGVASVVRFTARP